MLETETDSFKPLFQIGLILYFKMLYSKLQREQKCKSMYYY